MRELYVRVDEILNRVNFNNIWRGFSKFPFALYDKDNVYLYSEVIPYDHRFLGNTSVEYNGEYIAIWNVDDPLVEDSEILAANLAHEMFHAYQQKNQETRFPSDLILLNYPDSEENFTVKYCENLLLAKAFMAEDINEKNALIAQFISARKYRESLVGDIIIQEYLSETIEGMAEYAGSMALKQISHDKYIKKVNGYIENLQALDGRFFDIRRMLYYTGVIFCISLYEAGINFYHNISNTEHPLFTIVGASAKGEKPIIEIDNILLSQEIKRNTIENKSRFNEFLLLHHEKTDGDFIICGYDPMNMIKTDDMILCSHFIMLKVKNSDDEPVFIQGPVLLNLKKGSFNEVHSYIK
jgi:hypothetical protein